MTQNKLGKIYSKNQIDIATFIGGPLIAIYLISQNYKVFEDKVNYKNTLLYGLLLTLCFFAIIFLLPDNFPNISIAILPIFVANFIVKKYQGKQIEEYVKRGFPKASSFGVFGKSLLFLLITIIILVMISQLVYLFNVTFNWNNYLKNYCNSKYNEKNITNNKVFVVEDASCFVFKQLKEKGYTLEQIDKVLNLEFEYQKKIGIVGNPIRPAKESASPYNPVPFIIEQQTLALSKNQINEILAVEEEYLKLIGAIEK